MFRWVFWLVIPALSACTGLQVSSDYDSGADFTVLRGYDWLAPAKTAPGAPGIACDQLEATRVREIVEAQLARKGYVRDRQHPDFLVACQLVVEDRVSVTHVNELYGYGPEWGNPYRRNIRHYSPQGEVAMVSEYRQGTLLLDILSAADRRLIWRGTATGEVYPGLNREARERRLREAVEQVLARFPPPKE